MYFVRLKIFGNWVGRVGSKYTKLIQNIYSAATMYVSLWEKTNHTPIQRGVRQGSNIVSKLFISALDVGQRLICHAERANKPFQIYRYRSHKNWSIRITGHNPGIEYIFDKILLTL